MPSVYCLITFVHRSSEVRHPMLDKDPYGGNDIFGMVSLFQKRTAAALAPLLRVFFGSFFVCVVSLLAGDMPMAPQIPKFQ